MLLPTTIFSLASSFVCFLLLYVATLKFRLGRTTFWALEVVPKKFGFATGRHKQCVPTIAAFVHVGRRLWFVVVLIGFFWIRQLAAVINLSSLPIVFARLTSIHGLSVSHKPFLLFVLEYALCRFLRKAKNFPTIREFGLILTGPQDGRAIGGFGNGPARNRG